MLSFQELVSYLILEGDKAERSSPSFDKISARLKEITKPSQYYNGPPFPGEEVREFLDYIREIIDKERNCSKDPSGDLGLILKRIETLKGIPGNDLGGIV